MARKSARKPRAVEVTFAGPVTVTSSSGRVQVLPALMPASRVMVRGKQANRDAVKTTREASLTVACPRCTALSGEPCTRRNLQPRVSCHVERHSRWWAVQHAAKV